MTKCGMLKKEYNFYVYIVSSATGTLYIGVSNSLRRRVMEHKNGKIAGFSKKYSCNKLVYCEHHQYINNALEREKEIKKWRREKKVDLIKSINIHWEDLSNRLFEL